MAVTTYDPSTPSRVNSTKKPYIIPQTIIPNPHLTLKWAPKMAQTNTQLDSSLPALLYWACVWLATGPIMRSTRRSAATANLLLLLHLAMPPTTSKMLQPPLPSIPLLMQQLEEWRLSMSSTSKSTTTYCHSSSWGDAALKLLNCSS